MATYQACEKVGMPECRINLAHLVAYLHVAPPASYAVGPTLTARACSAEAPKSTRSYTAYNRAVAVAKRDMTLPVPLCVRNAPTRLMKELGYGAAYRYNPDYQHPVRYRTLSSFSITHCPPRRSTISTCVRIISL
jgi:putative ATPase